MNINSPLYRGIDPNQLQGWLRPPTEAEAALHKEIMTLPSQLVPRADRTILGELGMKQNQCTENCFRYARRMPDGAGLIACGWWRVGDNFIFHTVVKHEGTLFCITPGMLPIDQIEFRPDPSIHWITDRNENLRAVRGGKEFEDFVRKDPVATIAMMQEGFVAGGL